DGKYTKVELHDRMQEQFLEESGLKDLIIELGYDYDNVVNKENFPLVENELPDICADRIDYTIRDGLHLQIITRQKADQILDGLTIYNNEFVFSNEKAAWEYSFAFYLLN